MRGLVGRKGENLSVMKNQFFSILFTIIVYEAYLPWEMWAEGTNYFPGNFSPFLPPAPSLSLSLLSLDTIKLTLQPRTICCQRMIYTSYEFGVDFLHINKIQYHDASGELR